jgi:HEAT repeat protein
MLMVVLFALSVPLAWDLLFARFAAVPQRVRKGQAMSFERIADIESRSTEEILTRMEEGSPDVLAAGLEALRNRAAGNRGELLVVLRSESPIRRWAAATSLGSVPDSRGELTEALGDDDVRVRVAAAQSLAQLGSRDGVPALIEALTSNQVMLGHPPVLVADHAAQVLEFATGTSAAAPQDNAEARAAKWRQWWSLQD